MITILDYYVKLGLWIPMVIALIHLYQLMQVRRVRLRIIAHPHMVLHMGHVHVHTINKSLDTVEYFKVIRNGERSLQCSKSIGMQLRMCVILVQDGRNAEVNPLNIINGCVLIIKP